jgi:hypothetical protein
MRTAIGSVPVAFTLAAAALGQPCQPQWSNLDSGVNGAVRALEVFDDGSGTALYVAGEFTQAGGNPVGRIARWDGQNWSSVGLGVGANSPIRLLEAFDDGNGPALYAIGDFTEIDGVPAQGAARWDGQSWSAVGDGLYKNGAYTSAVFDDGSGPALFAGGRYLKGQDEQYVARLDGAAWTPLAGLDGEFWIDLCPVDFVHALQPYDDGAGPALYAGGRLDWVYGAPSMNVARWTGTLWEAIGGLGDECDAVTALGVFDDGGGPQLLAITYASSWLYGWDGAQWNQVPGSSLSGNTTALHAHTNADGPALYAGLLSSPGWPLRGIARWDGASWSEVGGGITGVNTERVYALESFEGSLYAAGTFNEAGGVPAQNIAVWGCGKPCPADCDASGGLDLFDFLCFVNRYNAGDSFGDCTDDGTFDFFDFVCFINLFNAGC